VIRRQFIVLLGGAAAAWPLTARAQQPAMPVVGFVNTRSADVSAHLIAAFNRGLAENGYLEGQTVRIEYRWANGQYARLPALATELASQRVAVLVATGGEPAAMAAKAASSSIPIVFAIGGDPVKLGLVASYNRPGGNATGINILTNELAGKRLGLLYELTPKVTSIGFLINPTMPIAETPLSDTQEAAHAIGVRLHVFRASTDSEIDLAFENVAKDHISALAVAADPFYNTRREKLVALAARHGVPALFQSREYPEAGGLMSYGINLADVYRQVGEYVGRILKGDKPANLPVAQPTKFELVINLKTAKTLGLEIPPTLLSRADEVIE
jgi:putative tryptophan/tyrosine transport system substrate-binding protein